MDNKILKIIFLGFFSTLLTAQTTVIKNDIVNDLISNGFENIRIKIVDNNLYSSFENRTTRFNVQGIAEGLNLLNKYSVNFDNIFIVVLNNNIPYVSAISTVSGGSVEIIQETEEIWNLLKDEEIFNSSNFNSDIILAPGIKVQFGDYQNPVQPQINLVPEIITGLWDGMKASAEVIFPLYNEFPGEGDYIRPGKLVLNQQFHLPDLLYVSSSLGYFSNNRYGAGIELRKSIPGLDITLGSQIGYTGFLLMYDNKIVYSDLYYFTALADVELRINRYNLILDITAGQYLYNDRSIRIDINRWFGEIEIGFFYNKSFKYESNAGFNFSIPIFPSKYSDPGLVRFRPASDFSYEYRIKGKIYNLSGLMYDTGFSLKKDMDMFNAGFIRNQLNDEYRINP